jgi:hypothetical protein
MKPVLLRRHAAAAITAGMLLTAGCYVQQQSQIPPYPPLGTITDSMWKIQETHGEAADFIVWQHEFELNGLRINRAGEDHIKKIAVRIHQGEDTFPVIIERSMTSPQEGTKYEYPIHRNRELDLRRREVVVRVLENMGIADAESRVIVAPTWTN